MFHNLKIFFTENLVGGYSNLIFHTETNLVNDACGRAGIKTHRPRILPFQITVGVGCFPWLSYLRVYRTHKSIPGSEPQKKKKCLFSSNSFFYGYILLALKFSPLAYMNQLILEIIVNGVHKSPKIPFNFFILIEMTKSVHQSWFLEVSLDA